ncbi:hypothetical protein OC861_006659, partial [Tilletia horrida]
TLMPPHVFTGISGFKLTPSGANATCSGTDCGPGKAMFNKNDPSAKRFDSDPDAGIEIRIICP